MIISDPHARYLDQPWHTVATLRALSRVQAEHLIAYSAKLGACAALERIEQTPNAWRIYGTIDDLLTRGYTADQIVAWLCAGRAQAESAP